MDRRSEDISRDLANSYSAYLKVDNEKEMNSLDECMDDTLTRLEELENGIKMMQAERESLNSCDLASARSNLNELCQRIHKLDELSKKVLQDVESIESIVDKAESDLIESAEGKLKNMLKPLLFMKSDTASASLASSSAPTFTPRQSFQTSSFFPKQNENKSLSSSESH